MLIGLLAGVLSGFLGVGGGILMVPALVLLFRFPQSAAHATSLAAIVPIGLAGGISFAVAGEVAYLPALVLSTTSIAGAVLGARLMARIPERSLQGLFGAALLLAAVRLAL
jgi:hypothetical protein